MKIANINGSPSVVLSETEAFSVHTESQGRFGPGMAEALADWPELVEWAANHRPRTTVRYDATDLGPVSPRPAQVFAIGLNYDEHSRETGLAVDREFPPVFPKWASSVASPFGAVPLPEGGTVDWEVELVVVMGRECSFVSPDAAWDHIAGFAVGQDYSDRKMQFIGQAPQFGLAKSHRGFSPVGPYITTTDEIDDLDSAEITCTIDGETKQAGTLGQMIFPVPQILSILSRVVTLYPGDLVFTGTPSGVGYTRTPAEFLRPGQTVNSSITGLGHITQKVV